MKNTIYIIVLLIIIGVGSLHAQDSSNDRPNLPKITGQLSSWANINGTNSSPVIFGARYIPQINYELEVAKNGLIDFEASANLYGSLSLEHYDSRDLDGGLRMYRLWGRYSNEQMEVRLGLQKIDFGTATILRPLRWFDQIDPRDPLQLTTGVYAALGRYYFLNNANIWFWVLYGNTSPKGMEILTTNPSTIEIGGRVQFPVPVGEVGISYHHRTAESEDFNPMVPEYAYIPEDRIGLDAKWDLVLGLWFEAVWVHKSKDLGQFTNQELFTVGTDYTFGLGNGLNVVLEHMITSYDVQAFQFSNTNNFTALSASYPVGMFDNLQLIVYYDWVNKGLYNFVNWYRQFNRTTLYVMAYWNPENQSMPSMGMGGENLYQGLGLQIMFVFNH